MPTSDQKSPAFGWAIHALTASGVVVGLLGLLWLASFKDGVKPDASLLEPTTYDGPFAY